MHADAEIFQVEQDINDILLHTGDGRVFVQHAVDFDLHHGAAGQGRQKHTPQGVAESVPKAPIQRLQGDPGAALVDGFHINQTRLQQFGSDCGHR